ncbi:MAG: class I SAM-dependent methyltransferase [Zoogloeaceae bacterium]|jgi:SAM-dependent methyltransferase|nr:class I SAM-dependent methyltransferase [Zoogloeaceae bacterium]
MDSDVIRHAQTPPVTDGLEQLILREISTRRRANMPSLVLDFPCGDGLRAVEMARAGATVLAADAENLADQVAGNALAGNVREQVNFVPCRLGLDPLPIKANQPLDLVFCHYGLSFMPYAETCKILLALLKSLRIGGKLFVSMHGLHSALGEDYRDHDAAIESRFCTLSPAVAKCYGIRKKICLYSERDLMRLLITTGGGVLHTFTSTHGAVKGVTVRI